MLSLDLKDDVANIWTVNPSSELREGKRRGQKRLDPFPSRADDSVSIQSLVHVGPRSNISNLKTDFTIYK